MSFDSGSLFLNSLEWGLWNNTKTQNPEAESIIDNTKGQLDKISICAPIETEKFYLSAQEFFFCSKYSVMVSVPLEAK